MFSLHGLLDCGIIAVVAGCRLSATAKQNIGIVNAMPARINIIGQRFTRLLVIAEADSFGYESRRSLCSCDCGSEIIVSNRHLRSGGIRSCGCLRRESMRKSRTKHGKCGTRIYEVWCGMKARCTNPNHNGFDRYSGFMCERWSTFQNFIADMGEGKPGWTLERIDNKKGYDISNMCWATAKRQARNKNNNRVITVRGITACMAELCERFGCIYTTVMARLNRGWDHERAFFEPTHKRTKPVATNSQM